MQSLKDKSALVTGASRGIGRATALALAERGAKVALAARSTEQLEKLAAQIRADGGTALPLSVDARDSAAVDDAVAEAAAALDGIDILVNNAGVTRDTLLIRMKDADWDDVIGTNLSGAFYFARSAARGMMRQRSGRIVNISSVVGVSGNAGQANYAASKAGLIGLTKSMAKELAPRGVTVNAVAPGFIETDMTAALSEGIREAVRASIPLGCFGEADDAAAAVCFLASDAARYITGQVLQVDGGLAM